MSLNKFTFILFVLIPTLVTGVYYNHIASDQYISESRYIIQGNSQQSVDILGMVTGLTGTSASRSDSLAVESYLISHHFLEKINEKVDIRSTYSSDKYDWWARLKNPSTQEEILSYWESTILDISFDPISGISTLTITAFDPKTAYDLSYLVLELSEKFINSISKQSRNDALAFANTEVINAQKKLSLLRQEITQFNKNEKVISADQDATAEQSIVANLKQKLAVSEAEYKKLTSYMQPTALKAISLRNEIESIKRQIFAQQQRWVSNINGKNISSVVQDTASLRSEIEFAETIYMSALSGLKQAQIDSTQKQRYLDVIVPPQLPDEALMPERIYSTLSFFLACIMLWGIFSLILSSIRDHLSH